MLCRRTLSFCPGAWVLLTHSRHPAVYLTPSSLCYPQTSEDRPQSTKLTPGTQSSRCAQKLLLGLGLIQMLAARRGEGAATITISLRTFSLVVRALSWTVGDPGSITPSACWGERICTWISHTSQLNALITELWDILMHSSLRLSC